ncbi:MAG TPA: hypothetical protein VFC15_17785, partial [Candidatus Limnocylindrales bacterium]|nr:hypothetical protein [Candidatus Limnocylindrales bacterium]
PPGRDFFSLNFAQELLGRLPAGLTRHAAILGFECMCSRQTSQHKHFRSGKTDHESGDVTKVATAGGDALAWPRIQCRQER